MTLIDPVNHAKFVGLIVRLLAPVAILMGAFVSDPDWKRFDYLCALIAFIGGNLIDLAANILASVRAQPQ